MTNSLRIEVLTPDGAIGSDGGVLSADVILTALRGPEGPRGADGTSVRVLGTLADIGDLPTSGNAVSDGYLINGDLHIWDGSTWINAGPFQGPIGYTGSQGPQGETGFTGFTGSQGSIGFTGSRGEAGQIGFTGSRGEQGASGVQGYTGSQGVIGFTGSVGSTGATGYTGSVGQTGASLTVLAFDFEDEADYQDAVTANAGNPLVLVVRYAES